MKTEVSGRMVICRDGGVVVFDSPRLQLSRQQIIALAAICHGDNGCHVAAIHEALWRNRRPLTGSMRASLARMLRRLAEQDIVERAGNRISLTSYGTKIAMAVCDLMKVNRAADSNPLLTEAAA